MKEFIKEEKNEGINKNTMFIQTLMIFLSGNQLKKAADFAQDKGNFKMAVSLVTISY